MTDQENTPADDLTEADEAPHLPRDPALEVLCVQVAGHENNKLGITISVAGSVITGDLVGPAAWWSQLNTAHGDAA